MISALKDFFSSLIRNKYLILELTKREFTDKYSGQMIGRYWTFLHPIFMMGVYLFLFTAVFKSNTNINVSVDFSIYLLSGLTVWLATTDVLTKSTTVIVSNANMVKQVVFPLEVLPIKTVSSSIFTMLVFIAILLIYTIVFKHEYSMMLLLLPLAVYLQLMFLIGVSFILSCMGTYLRDLKDVVQVLAFVGIFLLPVVYHPSQIPYYFKPIIYLNPFSYIIFCYQDIFYYQCFEHWYAWVILLVMSHAVLAFGYILFNRLKSLFGDVL